MAFVKFTYVFLCSVTQSMPHQYKKLNVLSKWYEILSEHVEIHAETCRRVLIKKHIYVFYYIICIICNIEVFFELVVNILSVEHFV